MKNPTDEYKQLSSLKLSVSLRSKRGCLTTVFAVYVKDINNMLDLIFINGSEGGKLDID